MTRVTCRLTAKNWDQLRNPTLGNRAWATFSFLFVYNTVLWFSWCPVVFCLPGQSVRRECIPWVDNGADGPYIHYNAESTSCLQKLAADGRVLQTYGLLSVAVWTDLCTLLSSSLYCQLTVKICDGHKVYMHTKLHLEHCSFWHVQP